MTNGMNGCACNNSRMRAFMCPNLAQINNAVETPFGPRSLTEREGYGDLDRYGTVMSHQADAWSLLRPVRGNKPIAQGKVASRPPPWVTEPQHLLFLFRAGPIAGAKQEKGGVYFNAAHPGR